MPFELIVAFRFLREGRFQTLLILSGVAVGAAVIVFLVALITGLQDDLIARTLGTQPHVVLRPPDDVARSVLRPAAGETVAAEVEKRAQRLRSIDGWQRALADAAGTPGVTAVSPMASGPAFATRGSAQKSVALLGIEQERYLKIVPVDRKMVAGRFHVAGEDAVIGVDLAKDLGASVGDKVRLAAAGGRTQVVTVSGVFDLGLRDLNRRWVLITLRSAQTLLDLAGGVTNIDLTVSDLFAAETVARSIAARTGLTAESWMKTNAELLVGLRGQSGSSAMIQFFVSVAVAFGISSVLVVSVVQKSREIGILRAMGASRRAVMTIFLVQGAIVALAGSLVGSALGTWAALAFQSWQGVFHVWLGWQLYAAAIAGATAIGVVAALAPAFRAAHLEPVAAIRYGG
ncbi:MAG: ABC transporter permease [Candidatus Methylomirabilia bacterium]